MMGHGDSQRTLLYRLSLESFVPPEHPLRAIRPFIDDRAIRRACRDRYAPIGRPSIPPEQLVHLGRRGVPQAVPRIQALPDSMKSFNPE
jgi:transposase